MIEVSLQQKPASKEMLNWQFIMLYAQLQLLGDHVLDHGRCPCEKKDETGEFCIAKHLTAIAEGYCTETIPMVDNDALKQVLSRIRNGATDLRREYLKAMIKGKEPLYDDIAEFARDARKELEPYLWQYKGGVAMKMFDPLLAEITRQVCSTGICLAESRKKSKLPICSAPEKKKVEQCILDVKAKLPNKCEPYWSKSASKQPDDCVNPWAVCRASLGCRPGSRKEKVR